MADARIVPDPVSPDAKPAVSRGARACTVCRTAKMKCVGAEDDGAKPCQRCRRSNLECVFEKHRRGRKPGSKLSEASKMLRKLEKGLTSAKVKVQDPSELSPQLPPQLSPQLPFPVSDSRSDQQYHSRYSPRELCVPSQVQRDPIPAPYPSASASQFPTLTAPYPLPRYAEAAPAPTAQRAPSAASRNNNEDDDPADDDDKDADDTIYPAKMVEREGRRHSFFGTVLDNPGQSKPLPKTQSPSQPPPQHPRIGSVPISRHSASGRLEDPLSTGIVSESELPWLFQMVHERLNPFINLFDPSLHTPAYVAKSPFLFSALVMVACKFWKPDSFKPCQRLAEEYCVRAFQEGWKGVEVVQAFACMTYWKDPDDTRTWTYIGYACRMAVELGLNIYYPTPPPHETATERLERRNRERTYLVLWVHDRSLSMQTGRQWMLPEDDLVRNSATWHENSTFLPVDLIISAQVQLRRIAAEVTDVFYLHKGAAGALHADVNYDILLQACNGKLNVWNTAWQAALKHVGGDTFQSALLTFFRLHVRLFLNSFGLQTSLIPSRHPSSSVLAACYTSALETLKLVNNEFAQADMVRYCQDSMTVMTAYSAIFLLKLLRTRNELEDTTPRKEVQKHILDAAQAYLDAAKAMPPSSSVQYHGRFLRTLVTTESARHERKRAGAGQANGNPVPPAHEPRQATAQPGQEYAGPGHAWHFPASPHLPAHPLVPPEQAQVPYAEQTQPEGYAQKMEVAYWYNIHADLGYGSGVNSMPGGYMNAQEEPQQAQQQAQPQRQQQQQQQQQQPYQVYGHTHPVPPG